METQRLFIILHYSAGSQHSYCTNIEKHRRTTATQTVAFQSRLQIAFSRQRRILDLIVQHKESNIVELRPGPTAADSHAARATVGQMSARSPTGLKEVCEPQILAVNRRGAAYLDVGPAGPFPPLELAGQDKRRVM